MQVMDLQARYSWHKTAINHHSLQEWGPADRKRSSHSWKPAMFVAFILTLFEWIREFLFILLVIVAHHRFAPFPLQTHTP